jgi:hypothetical protein
MTEARKEAYMANNKQGGGLSSLLRLFRDNDKQLYPVFMAFEIYNGEKEIEPSRWNLMDKNAHADFYKIHRYQMFRRINRTGYSRVDGP